MDHQTPLKKAVEMASFDQSNNKYIKLREVEDDQARLISRGERPPKESVVGLLTESELPPGLTDKQAVSQIMSELRTILQQKEEYFKDQRDKRCQQVQVVIRKLLKLETILTLAYIAILFHNLRTILEADADQVRQRSWFLA